MTVAALLTDEEILTGIAEVAREHLDWKEAIAPELRLVEDLRLDSVRLLTLAIEVENRFRVHLNEVGGADDELGETAIETVSDLVAAVRRAAASGVEPNDG